MKKYTNKNILIFANGFLVACLIANVVAYAFYFNYYRDYKAACDMATPDYLKEFNATYPALYLKAVTDVNRDIKEGKLSF